MRIGICEDDPQLQSVLGRALRAEDFEVRVTATGHDAVRVFSAEPPDLLVLDIGLPDADGRDVCQALRAHGVDAPVIFLTARGQLTDKLAAFHAGGDDFLTKPVEYETLMARVRSLIRLKRLLDEWRARGATARAMGLTSESVAPPSVAGARALVVGQWYPQIAVYDDLKGWDATPYLGDGEFYLEYGDFDVELTLPAGWIVGATGTLANPAEVLSAQTRARLAQATQSAFVADTNVPTTYTVEPTTPSSKPATVVAARPVAPPTTSTRLSA